MATLRAVVEDAMLGDTVTGLEALGLLHRWLARREEELVLAARSEGCSWDRIGDALGRSKQAVWEKYRHA